MAASFKIKYALILRGIQWVALIPIIGIIAHFVHLLRMDSDPIPSAVMAALVIPVIACFYVTVSLVGLYTAHSDSDDVLRIPHLPALVADAIFLLSFVCTAGVLTNPVTHLPCTSLEKGKGNIAAELASVQSNALKRNFWVWVGTSRSFCQQITVILILLWVLTLLFLMTGLFEFSHWFKTFRARKGYKKDVV